MGDEPDRRVRRTKDALRQALIALIVEKERYERVSVQDILARADVGRSTFYAHFQNKDDLLLGSFRELKADIEASGLSTPGDILGAIRAIFRYADDHRELFHALVGRREPALLAVQRELNEILAEHLRAYLTSEDVAPTVAFVLNGMTGIVHWWFETNAPITADEAYERFRRLAMQGIEPLLR